MKFFKESKKTTHLHKGN